MFLLRKIPLLILFSVFVSSTYGQTYSNTISDDEIVSFLNWKFQFEKKYSEEPKGKPKLVYYKIANWDTSTFFADRKKGIQDISSSNYLFPGQRDWKWIDTIFSKEDREYLYQQFNSQKDTIWKTNFRKTKLSKEIKQKKPNRYYISLPLFSLNKKYVIIKQVYYCGSLCAYREFKIYRRKGDDSWEYVGSANSWIS
jgi:hypothetical protein